MSCVGGGWRKVPESETSTHTTKSFARGAAQAPNSLCILCTRLCLRCHHKTNTTSASLFGREWGCVCTREIPPSLTVSRRARGRGVCAWERTSVIIRERFHKARKSRLILLLRVCPWVVCRALLLFFAPGSDQRLAASSICLRGEGVCACDGGGG